MGPLDLTVSGVVLWADCESNCTNNTPGSGTSFGDDELNYGAGVLLGFGGFSLGAGYQHSDAFFRPAQADIANVGLKYGFGAAHVSIGYNYNMADDDDIEDAHIFVVSGDVGILPGVVLKGDVAYNTDDIGACEGGATECPATTTEDVGNNQDDTIGGVVSVQFNY